jgi:hypothetical protein
MMFGQSLTQQNQESKQPQKATAAKKATPAKKAEKRTEPADFSVLTAFKDALLDLKGAVEVGVNRQDYQRKLQTATAESLKAKDRLPDSDENAYSPVTHC